MIKNSLQFKLLIIFCGLAVLLIVGIGMISYINSKNILETYIQQDMSNISKSIVNMCMAQQELLEDFVKADYNIAHKYFYDRYSLKINKNSFVEWISVNQFSQESMKVTLPQWSLNDYQLTFNESAENFQPVVDDVKNISGATATVFQRMNDNGDMLRISTSVLNNEGNRAVGTYIPAINKDGTSNQVISSVLKGEKYYGRAFVVDKWYITVYAPILDDKNNVIGMLYAGRPEQSFESLYEAITRQPIGQSGYVFVLDSQGKYIVSKDRLRDGENILDLKDENDNYFIQEMIDKAKKLQQDESFIYYYQFQNPEDNKSQNRITAVAYFSDWDWIVGSTGSIDEMLAPVYFMRNIIIITIIISLLFSIAVILVLVNKFVLKPIKPLLNITDKLAKGDLKQDKISVKSNDEIGQLISSFNKMLDNLKVLTVQAEVIAADDLNNELLQEKIEGDLGSAFTLMNKKLSSFVEVSELIADDKIYDEIIDNFLEENSNNSEKGIQQVDTAVTQPPEEIKLGVLTTSFINMIKNLRKLAHQAEIISKDDLYNNELDTNISTGVLGTAFMNMRDILRLLACQAELIADDKISDEMLDAEISQGALGTAFTKMRDNLRAVIGQLQLIANDDLYNSELDKNISAGDLGKGCMFLRDVLRMLAVQAELIADDKIFDEMLDAEVTTGVIGSAFTKMRDNLRGLTNQIKLLANDDLYNEQLNENVTTGDIGNQCVFLRDVLRMLAAQAELISSDKIYDEMLDAEVTTGVLGTAFAKMRDNLRGITKQIQIIAKDDLYNEELDKQIISGALGSAFTQMRDILRGLAEQAELIAKDDLYNEELDKQISNGALGTSFGNMRDILRHLASQAELIATDDLYNSALMTKGTGTLSNAFAEMIKRLRYFAEISKKIASGDLTIKLDEGIDKGTLGNSYYKMISNLQDLIGMLDKLSSQINSTSEEMLSASTEMTKGIENQYSGIDSVQGSLEEMSASIKQVENTSQGTAATANTTREAATEGKKAVLITVEGLNNIKTAVDKTAVNMDKLEKRSKEISKIVKAISEISDQTNLLALNAAIEAARAGEHGKGFAVVADEVRKLAEKSSKNALEINGIIERIQEDIAFSVESMQEGKANADEGSQLVGKLENSFMRIEDMIMTTAQSVTEISKAIGEQVRAVNGITENMDLIVSASKQSKSGASSVVQVSNHLRDMVSELNTNIGKFKI